MRTRSTRSPNPTRRSVSYGPGSYAASTRSTVVIRPVPLSFSAAAMYDVDTPLAVPISRTCCGLVRTTWSYTARPCSGVMCGMPRTASATSSYCMRSSVQGRSRPTVFSVHLASVADEAAAATPPLRLEVEVCLQLLERHVRERVLRGRPAIAVDDARRRHELDVEPGFS